MPTKPTQYCPGYKREPRDWTKNAQSPRRVSGRALQARNNRIKVRDKFTCQNKQCNIITYDLQIDHRLALKQGGEDCDANLQALCAACHAIKSKLESFSKRLRNPSDFPLTYKASKLMVMKKGDDGDDEWGDLMGLHRPGGTNEI
jgi:5-methylcytosine-specific restriction endonuclease McrA